LVSSFQAFEDYQRNEAWVWEHQALVRARILCGSDVLVKRFQQLRLEILTRERDVGALRAEIISMRHRMRAQLPKIPNQNYDLVQGEGGIKDIEFLVQFFVLKDSHAHPALAQYTDTLHIIQELGRACILQADECQLLLKAYETYRKCLHRCTLQNLAPLADQDEFLVLREGVTRLWGRCLGS
jgi:glutamate-ammonia-ligase adenylyltransferase